MKAHAGDKITLFVSKGPDRVDVPDLRGKTADQARQLLKDADLSLGEVAKEFQDTVPADQITRQDPASGDKAERGKAVDVWISGAGSTGAGAAPMPCRNATGFRTAVADPARTGTHSP